MVASLRSSWCRWTSSAFAAAIACLLVFAASAQAATVTVTNTNDAGSGSLRSVITNAASGDTIAFEASLNGQTIDLASGAIAIDKSLTIAGPGASQLTIDANHDSRIFTVTAGNLAISGLTFANGAAPDTDTLVRGGAIEQTGAGSLSVSDSTFSGNSAGGDGGANDTSGRGRGGAIEYRGSGSLSVSGSTFSGNRVGGDGGAGFNSGLGRGGAIFVTESATSTSISGSTFTGNAAGGDGGSGPFSGRGAGGAIEVESGTGPLTITGSTFTDNVAGGREGGGPGGGAGVGNGGAINSFSALTITDSTFADNVAGGQGGSDDGGYGVGGAINNFNNLSPLTVIGSTFSGNTAGGQGGDGVGGAISASGVSPRSAFFTNSTFTGNTAGGGGGNGRGGALEITDIFSVTLANVTIHANAVGQGGTGAGINSTVSAISRAAIVTARATLVSGNTGATNCDAPVATSRYSLEGPSASDTSCGFDLPSADPQLAPLANNGGPTQTQALPSSSPAVDAVPAAHCPTTVDQRGEPRPEPVDIFCDIGAFESQDPFVKPVVTSGAAATFQVGKAGSFTVTTRGVPTPSLSQTGELPSGVTFTDNGDGTARLAGSPAAGTDGVYPIAIKASNGTLPDAAQSFTLTVKPTPPPIDPPVTGPPADDPTDPGPPSTPKPPLAVKLSLGVEKSTLRKLLRSGKLVVGATLNVPAKLVLTGRARLEARVGGKVRTRLVAVFEQKTVRFSRSGEKKATLVLTRKGRKALQGLRKARFSIAGEATDAVGKVARRTIGLTLRR